MKSILNNSKWAIACAMIALPFLTGCAAEPEPEGIDKSKTSEITVDEKEIEKPSKSVGMVD